MESDNSTVLVKKENLRIVQFTACDHIGFMYKNLLLNFNCDGFQEFCNAFGQLDFDSRCITFPDGSSRLVMNTCCKEIQLCFQRSEFNIVQDALQEASVMIEVNDILYPSSGN